MHEFVERDDGLCRECGLALVAAVHGPPQTRTDAHARRSDPWTSHAAAASVSGEGLRTSQADVLAVLADLGESTDWDLVPAYHRAAARGEVQRQSDSGIRTRRDELTEAGLVEYTGREVRLPSRRMAQVWRASVAGRAVARPLPRHPHER